jgi:Zn-dependent peptidase ImmA (M78 family)
LRRPVLPSVEDPAQWRQDEYTVLAAQHLLSRMDLDISQSDIEDDIVAALLSSSEIDFEWASSVTGSCELHGTYSAHPPRIRISRRLGTARANFTAAHELGHHLQEHDDEWVWDVLAGLRRTSPFVAQDVEERVSNQVAVHVLMPDDFVASQWGGVLSPEFVRALTREGRVSREAASLRAMGFAVAHGVEPTIIAVARPDGVVTSATASDGVQFAPPQRRTVQPDFSALADREPGRDRAIQGILYASGASRADLTYDWTWDNDGTHLFVVARPEYRFGDANWGADSVECLGPSCESVFSRAAAELCAKCVSPICPDCAACRCEKTEGATCSVCFMVMSIAESQRGTKHEDC